MNQSVYDTAQYEALFRVSGEGDCYCPVDVLRILPGGRVAVQIRDSGTCFDIPATALRLRRHNPNPGSYRDIL